MYATAINFPCISTLDRRIYRSILLMQEDKTFYEYDKKYIFLKINISTFYT